jgi:invasion protein IalB
MHLPASPRLVEATPALTGQLPNGASSVTETYGNWSVDCRVADGQKQCRLFQILRNSQANQWLFEVEFLILRDGKMEGTIVLPFGLKLNSGAVLKLDDQYLGQGLRFLTCVPAGCLLPVSFSMTGIDAMKNGKILTVASRNLNDEIRAFKVSLDGFAAASARIIELGSRNSSNSSMTQGVAGD